MKVPAAYVAEPRDAFLDSFDHTVRQVFHGERWADAEPFIARAFALLSHDYDAGPWEPVRDHLRTTWPGG